jgi:hypothetical protein
VRAACSVCLTFLQHGILFSCCDRFILNQGFRLDLESKLEKKKKKKRERETERDHVVLDFVLILFFCSELGELAVLLFMGLERKSFVIAEFQIACISTNMAPRSPFDKQRHFLSNLKSSTCGPGKGFDSNGYNRHTKLKAICHFPEPPPPPRSTRITVCYFSKIRRENKNCSCTLSEPRQLNRFRDSLRAGRAGDRIPVGGEIFRTRPDRPWGPPSLLYNGYRVSFPRGKAAGAWR